MKFVSAFFALALINSSATTAFCQSQNTDSAYKHPQAMRYFLDVHDIKGGKVSFEDVAKVHAKDLATEKEFGVHFIKFWVNESSGQVYCLSSASDSQSVLNTHAKAHGLMPTTIYQVSSGNWAQDKSQDNLFLDFHYLGAGNVTAAAVEQVHQKDVAVQDKYKVNFLNYWVDEKKGMVMCLSQTADSTSILKTHKEAHGLLPAQVIKVKQGD